MSTNVTDVMHGACQKGGGVVLDDPGRTPAGPDDLSMPRGPPTPRTYHVRYDGFTGWSAGYWPVT